jgi:hypothetical protein
MVEFRSWGCPCVSCCGRYVLQFSLYPPCYYCVSYLRFSLYLRRYGCMACFRLSVSQFLRLVCRLSLVCIFPAIIVWINLRFNLYLRHYDCMACFRLSASHFLRLVCRLSLVCIPCYYCMSYLRFNLYLRRYDSPVCIPLLRLCQLLER